MNSELNSIILSHQTTAVVVVNESLQIHYANCAAEQLFAQNAKRIAEQSLTCLIQNPSTDINWLARPFQTGQSITDSNVTLIIEGKPLILEVTASPISWQKQIMLLIELREVEQQRRLSQELNQHSQQQAAKLLVRGLAHEIKNPLGGLRGAAQLLERMLPDQSMVEYTQIIIEQADRLRLLVDRLLGPQKPGQKQNQNLHLILEKVRQLVDLEVGSWVNIERDYDPSLPEFLLDADQIEQALLNIVINAGQILKPQSDGHLIIRTRTVHQVNIHGQNYKLVAKIEIIDNGPGVPVELQDTLFYPMVSGREGGTGLGLSIAQNLIDQHQGKIELESWPGRTTFTIYLPISMT
ncbi:two-component system sensor histidine kinase NtrB [Vibrio zhanjiangensis]|uniref:histidine kinase n=1 Tax=Vibrio zhanjiangensis TaxID=1046128 RepID=A0ABQ6F499_9VIBR|nr:nitrogen regulation protein NR(II) [Vibrio zhanjiangensis]GLT20358.1 two-component system sensor histidine kinase NtrB [Vibrio zhanjiangensis]